ncbi:MAG TPA: SWIM zinc finger family protein [Pirellulales bacterium]|nr:SWIM zinc finger family protein [Pirellulales bacterium]
MQVKFAYFGHSRLQQTRGGQVLSLAPNLAREPVAFDAPLVQPLRFREAISALHDVVISDLRYKPRDKTAYQQWKLEEHRRLAHVHQEAYRESRDEILARRADVPRDLEEQYNRCRHKYWNARQKYADYLRRHDMELWRMLMPCDPITTIADDVVFFECFSADESSYGCLTVERQAMFGASTDFRRGTTNVDYSWALYDHFQQLRTYRETRFRVDPQGFEVAVAGQADYREEKIDLPAGWLRGLMQVQAAMTLPMRRVTLSREAVYSLLAWLKRHKARRSPRALRFELAPGEPPRIVVKPWEQAIVAHGVYYEGPGGAPIRTWGRQRLLVLARLLPLVERVDVYLLGSGLPSFWVAQMGDMRLTLGLSGWTANDWTRGAALDLLSPPVQLSPGLVAGVAGAMQTERAAPLADSRLAAVASPAECAAALNYLARTGQVIFDLDAGVYRWRQIMPAALGEADLGPEPAELVASREVIRRGEVRLVSREELGDGAELILGKYGTQPLSLTIDADGRMKRAKCSCSHFRRGGLRKGPCRHLLALRDLASGAGSQRDTLDDWFRRWQQWAAN